VLALVKLAAASGGGNFLIPNGTIVVEFVIFSVVLGTMAKLVLPVIQQKTDERAARISADQAASDQGGSEAAALDAEAAAALDAARAEARELLAQATEQAAQLVAQAREQGYAEFERRSAEAGAAADAERRRVELELSGRLTQLVADAAGKVLGEHLDPASHAAVLESALGAAQAEGGR
jgi:F-type H+-transporting ATPase subunit b